MYAKPSAHRRDRQSTSAPVHVTTSPTGWASPLRKHEAVTHLPHPPTAYARGMERLPQQQEQLQWGPGASNMSHVRRNLEDADYEQLDAVVPQLPQDGQFPHLPLDMLEQRVGIVYTIPAQCFPQDSSDDSVDFAAAAGNNIQFAATTLQGRNDLANIRDESHALLPSLPPAKLPWESYAALEPVTLLGMGSADQQSSHSVHPELQDQRPSFFLDPRELMNPRAAKHQTHVEVMNTSTGVFEAASSSTSSCCLHAASCNLVVDCLQQAPLWESVADFGEPPPDIIPCTSSGEHSSSP